MSRRFPIFLNPYVRKIPENGSMRFAFWRGSFATLAQCFPNRARQRLDVKRYRLGLRKVR